MERDSVSSNPGMSAEHAEDRFLEAESLSQELIAKLSALQSRILSYEQTTHTLAGIGEQLSDASESLTEICTHLREYLAGVQKVDSQSILRHIDEAGVETQTRISSHLEMLDALERSLTRMTESVDNGIKEQVSSLVAAVGKMHNMQHGTKQFTAEQTVIIAEKLEQIDSRLSTIQDMKWAVKIALGLSGAALLLAALVLVLK